MNAARKFFARITGGRPMRFDSFAFVDRVTGDRVNRYTDTLGRKWLAVHKWAAFRVSRT